LLFNMGGGKIKGGGAGKQKSVFDNNKGIF
jgi:hypothetical protein